MKKQLILVAFFSFIIFGFSFVNFVQAIEPIPGIPVGLEGEPSVTGEPITGVDVKLGTNNGGSLMVSTDLGINNVGILPTSRLYFLKELGRGINRLFTWNEVSKVKLELKITNEKAAELLEIEKENPDNIKAIGNALQNYTKAQDRLNIRIAGLSDTSSDPNIASLLKEVDDKTSKHIALLEQLNTKLVGDLTKAKENTDKILVATVEKGNDALALKQKAEEQIKSAGVAIEDANSALNGVATTRGINVNPGGADVRGSGKVVETIDEQSSIFDRWGNSILKAKVNLENAKKAFAEGKYGEAYGQARSALAMVPVLATGSNFPDKKVDVIVPTTPSAETKTEININTNKEPAKVLENNSPLPTEQKPIEQKDEPKPTPTSTESTSEKRETSTTNSAGGGSAVLEL